MADTPNTGAPGANPQDAEVTEARDLLNQIADGDIDSDSVDEFDTEIFEEELTIGASASMGGGRVGDEADDEALLGGDGDEADEEELLEGNGDEADEEELLEGDGDEADEEELLEGDGDEADEEEEVTPVVPTSTLPPAPVVDPKAAATARAVELLRKARGNPDPSEPAEEADPADAVASTLFGGGSSTKAASKPLKMIDGGDEEEGDEGEEVETRPVATPLRATTSATSSTTPTAREPRRIGARSAATAPQGYSGGAVFGMLLAAILVTLYLAGTVVTKWINSLAGAHPFPFFASLALLGVVVLMAFTARGNAEFRVWSEKSWAGLLISFLLIQLAAFTLYSEWRGGGAVADKIVDTGNAALPLMEGAVGPTAAEPSSAPTGFPSSETPTVETPAETPAETSTAPATPSAPVSFTWEIKPWGEATFSREELAALASSPSDEVKAGVFIGISGARNAERLAKDPKAVLWENDPAVFVALAAKAKGVTADEGAVKLRRTLLLAGMELAEKDSQLVPAPGVLDPVAVQKRIDAIRAFAATFGPAAK